MTVANALTGKLGREPPNGGDSVFDFLSKAGLCGEFDPSLVQESARAFFKKSATDHWTIRENGRAEGGGQQIRASLSVFQPCVQPDRPGLMKSPNADIFLIDALRVDPELCGFAPNACDLLVSAALTKIAITDCDEGRSRVIGIAAHMDNVRMQAMLRRFGAVRVAASTPENLALMSLASFKQGGRQPLWRFTGESEAIAAANVLKMVADNTPPLARRDRGTQRDRYLFVEYDLPWVRRLRDEVEAVAAAIDRVEVSPMRMKAMQSKDER